LLILADAANLERLEMALRDLQAERRHDREYWQPLKAELERLRHSSRSESQKDEEPR